MNRANGYKGIALIECVNPVRNKWRVRWGLTPTDETGENVDFWEEEFGHQPTLDEVKTTIIGQINASTDAKILNGLKWNGSPVYLSTENQFNFKAAHDLAVQTGGKNMPVKFKIGELEDSTAVYHTFETTEELTEFVTTCMAYVQQCLQEGWTAKDSIDWTKYECDD